MRGTPSVTALNGTNTRDVELATRWASVVFPLPGGPQKIIEPGTPRSIASRSGLPGASRCSCPTNSSSVRGRMRAASGWPSRGRAEERLALLGTPFPCHDSSRAAYRIHRSSSRSVRKNPSAPPKNASAVEPAPLGLELRDQVRRRDVERHSGGERQAVARERRDLLGEQDAQDRRQTRAPRPRRAPARGSARRPPSRSRSSRPPAACAAAPPGRAARPARPETRNPLAIATPSKKVCSVSPSSAEMPGRPADPVGLLAEVEVGGEDVLRQVDREVARRARRAPRLRPSRRTSGSTPSRATASMNPAPNARQASMNRRLAPQVAHHRERPPPRCPAPRRRAKPERVHRSSRASASRRSRVLSGGIVQHPVEQQREHLADRAARGSRAPAGRRPLTARSPRASGSRRSRIARTAPSPGRSAPCRSAVEGEQIVRGPAHRGEPAPDRDLAGARRRRRSARHRLRARSISALEPRAGGARPPDRSRAAR